MPALGNEEQLTFTTQNVDGTYYDPHTVTITYGPLGSAGSTETIDGAVSGIIVRKAQGQYSYTVPAATQEGHWNGLWKAYDMAGNEMAAKLESWDITGLPFGQVDTYPSYCELSDVYARMYAGRDGFGAPDNTRRDEYIYQLIQQKSRNFDEATHRAPGAYAPLYDVRLYSGRGEAILETDDYASISKVEQNRSPGTQAQYGQLGVALTVAVPASAITLGAVTVLNLPDNTVLQIGAQSVIVNGAQPPGTLIIPIVTYTPTATLPIGTAVTSTTWSDYTQEFSQARMAALPMRFWPKHQLFRQSAFYVDPFRTGNVRLTGLWGIVQPDFGAIAPVGRSWRGLSDMQIASMQPIQPATGTPAGWWVTPPLITEAVAIWVIYSVKAGESEYADMRPVPGQAPMAAGVKREMWRQGMPQEIKHIVDIYSDRNLRLALIATDGTDPRDERMAGGGAGGYRWAGWQSYDPSTGVGN